MSIPMIVLGDSILWGQGLQEQDKMYTQVRRRDNFTCTSCNYSD
jgi:hypothetical protein